MDEQSFIELMDMIVTTLKTVKKIADENIPFALTECIIKLGLPFENCTEIGDSNIHGNGLFAKSDIPKDKVISVYPCHGIIKGELEFNIEKNKINQSPFNPGDYKIKLTKDETTFIYANPNIHDKYCLGHILNDSYKDICDFKNVNETLNFGKIMVKYILNSIRSDNCILVSKENYVYVKTKRSITIGEELTNSYGFPYWCHALNLYQINSLTTEYMLSLSENQQIYIKKLLLDYTL